MTFYPAMNGNYINEYFNLSMNSTIKISELFYRGINSTDSALKLHVYDNKTSGPVKDAIWMALIIIK